MRDDKEPQIVINRARPISDYANADAEPAPAPQPAIPAEKVLYLRLPSENCPQYQPVKASLQMFPGETKVVLFFADTGARRGTKCAIDDMLLTKLRQLLGEGNIVLK